MPGTGWSWAITPKRNWNSGTFKSNLPKNIWPGESTPRTCAPSLGSIGFPWGVTAFQSFVHRIYKKIYLTWPVNAKNMCAKFGVDRVSLRSYSVSKFRQSNLQNNISDLASQRQEHVCQVWGRSEVSLRSYSVSKFRKSNLQKNIWPGQSTPRTCAPSLGSIGFPWGVTAFQSFVNRIYKKIYLTWPVNAKNMCAKFGVDRRFPWGVTAFQSFVNRIYKKNLTWPINAKNMCAKFGVDRVSLRSYSVSKFRPSNLQKNISDLASQHQEHVCQVWGRSEVSLRSYSVSKFCKSNLQKNIWPGQSTPRTCAPSLGSIGFPWGVTAFQSFVHRIYKKIYLTWPVNTKNMCAKFGVDRRFPWGVTAFQSFVNRIYKKISDLASQRQEHVRQVWGRSGFPEELQRFKVS